IKRIRNLTPAPRRQDETTSAIRSFLKPDFVETDQADLPVRQFVDAAVQPFLKKYSVFPKTQISCMSFAVLSHSEGRLATSRTRGGMRWTRRRRLTGVACSGRRRRVVLTPRRWRQVCGLIRVTTVARKPITGEHGISRKPLRAGMSGFFRWLAVNTRVHTYYPMRTRGCGCIGRPAFPTPSSLKGGKFMHPSGASRRENAKVCLV